MRDSEHESIDRLSVLTKFATVPNIQISLLGRKGGELKGTFEYTRTEWEGRQRVLKEHQANENIDRRKCIREELKSLREQYKPPGTTDNKYGFGRIGIGTPISDVVSKMNGQILHDFEKSADEKKRFQIVDWTDTIFNEEYEVRGYSPLDSDIIQHIRLTNINFRLKEGDHVEQTGYSANEIDEVCSADGAASFAKKIASINGLGILSIKYSETHNGGKETEKFTSVKITVENEREVARSKRHWRIKFSKNNISSKLTEYYESSLPLPLPDSDLPGECEEYFSCTKYVFLGDWLRI